MNIRFSTAAWEQYLSWSAEPATLERINTLIKACTRDPFKGIGKPEPLKGDLKGWWSRRITKEHRLVYRVSGTVPNQELQIVQLKFHY